MGTHYCCVAALRITLMMHVREIVRRGLENSLPDDAHDVINNREGSVTVGITQLFPRPKGVFVSEFNSRADLIEVLLGSW